MTSETTKREKAKSPTVERSQSIEWYSEGEERTVEVDGVHVTVRFVGRKGRRGRISVVAPAGAVFLGGDVEKAIITGSQIANDGDSPRPFEGK